jgi:adenosylcobinamide kinase/adenosylcobinamide-phosphate guanylyltransferase
VNDKVLIIGGCRSGKSRFALEKANSSQVDRKIFVATSQAQDEEMALRITRHQAERGPDWETIESPVALPQTLDSILGQHLVLVDCLTMWLNNLMMDDLSEQQILDQFQALQESFKRSKGPVFLISNEVGAGIVPENKLIREYRDYLGLLNQRMATCADHVIFMVAGLPMSLK